MSSRIEWMLITAEPDIARYAEESGVHRIFVDMEVLGKAERQGHVDTHKASHTYEDITAVRAVLTTSELMVRVNPLHEGTGEEVSETIIRGADRLMLPMFSTADEVAEFRALVPTGVPITYLAETPAALVRTGAWLRHLQAGDEVHFGLNDLSLAMGLDFLFEPMAADLIQGAARLLRRAGIPFGVGGVARPDSGALPATMVIGEHVRLGSTRLILSRAFHGSANTLAGLVAVLDLPSELMELQRIEDSWRAASEEGLARNLQQFAERSFAIAAAGRTDA